VWGYRLHALGSGDVEVVVILSSRATSLKIRHVDAARVD
jgi:hypothetical protein